ncbi:hypothetical protein EON67_05985 [archaeon]|nr:MAG: hypothetical protein EON67_05985 [archaeon]
MGGAAGGGGGGGGDDVMQQLPPTPLLARAHSTESTASVSGGGMTEDERRIARWKDTQLQMLRSRLECSVCRKNFKDVVLMRCSHLFCQECIDNNIKARHRKCPACGKPFGTDDVKKVYFAS